VEQRWALETSGEQPTARHVVVATGALAEPVSAGCGWRDGRATVGFDTNCTSWLGSRPEIDCATDCGAMRRAKLNDVARRAGVSSSTASRALNGIGELSDETRDAVTRAAEDLQYRPSPLARTLRTRRSGTVGLVVPTVAHSFYAALTNGAQRMLEEHGYRLILIDSGEDPKTLTAAVQTLLDHEVDGILMSTAPVGAKKFNVLLDGTPCVFIDELAPGAGVGNVALENARGMGLLVDHVAGHGHEVIGYLGGPNDRTSGAERLRGFLEAMDHNRLEVFPELSRECEWTIASGFAHAEALLAQDRRPTALITASGELALGALVAARRANLSIPGHLALASFDDLYFAPLLEPSLTAIAYDTPSVGQAGARLLLAAIRGEPAPQSEMRIDVELVPRRSCGCERDSDAAMIEVLG
jgi:LacI family transcriptional regulator